MLQIIYILCYIKRCAYKLRIDTKVIKKQLMSSKIFNDMDKLPIYRFLVPDDDSEIGVDAVALVDYPAIEMNWQAFSAAQEFESYTDYPQAATENAKIALRWAE